MRDLPDLPEVTAAWLNQPEEAIPVDIERIYKRRAWALFSDCILHKPCAENNRLGQYVTFSERLLST